jgi:hypothetical protein
MSNALLPVLLFFAATSAQPNRTAQPAVPVEPITALLEAIETHDLVALADPHGNNQARAFRLSLIGDPRFAESVNDIVVEWGNALYQDVADRYVGGEDIADHQLRQVWRNTTQPQPHSEVPLEELLRAVRVANTSLSQEDQLRVLLGDPPIDWDEVKTRDDHQRFLYQRDTHPSDLIQREVLDRGRRALVLYGAMHLQRHNLFSNYELVDDSRLHTLVQQLERETEVSILTVWGVPAELDALQPDVASWPVPSLAHLPGTRLGAADFTFYYPSTVPRSQLQNGRIVPIPEDEWGSLVMEDQFDALLYLGPPSAMTESGLSPELCNDSEYMATRRERLALLGMLLILEELERWCQDNSPQTRSGSPSTNRADY